MLIVLLFNSVLFPQQYLFELYSTEENLSQTDVRGLTQDKNGFIWAATQDGLNRWDGYNFKVYRNDPADPNSLSNSGIACVFIDNHGFVWVGTGDGLNKFDAVTGKNIRYLAKEGDSTKLQGKLIFGVNEDINGNIWIGTYLGGLSVLNKKTGKIRTYRHDSSNPNSLGSDNVLEILIDKEGILWLTTFPNGLCRFDPAKNEFKTFTLNESNRPDSYASFTTYLAHIDDDNILVGTYKGFVIFNTENFSYKRIEKIRDINGNNIHLKRINRLITDKKGKFYIGTADQGLIIYNIGDSSFINVKNNELDDRSLSDNFVSSVYLDKDDNLWVGTLTGLNRLIKSHTFNFINKLTELKLSNPIVRSVYEDKKGRMWVGTENGLNIIDRKRNTIKYLTTELSATRVVSICEGEDGTVWVGTIDGINQINENLLVIRKIKTDPASGITAPLFNVGEIYKDQKGNLWLGTYGLGLIFYNPKLNSFKHYIPDNKDPNSIIDVAIYDIKEDSKKNIWIASAMGLNKYNPESDNFIRFMHDYNDKKGLPADEVNSIFPNEDGTLWLGMQGAGIALFDENKGIIESYTTTNGLANNIVDAIEKDNNGNLWVATNIGLSKIDLRTKKIYSYFYSDGLPDDGFYLGASFKSNDNIFLGTAKGVVFFNPDDVKTETKNSSLVITDFKIFERSVPGNELLRDNQTITLDFNDNFFSFEFAALDYGESFKYSYAYMLEGIDKDWVHSGNRRFASYTHIDPGNYVFKVKALNGNGEWISGVSAAVIIKPPFWQTWWFRSVIVILFLSIGPAIYYRRVSGLKKENLIKEEFSRKLIMSQENERMRIASELHDSVGQNLIIIKNRAAFGIDYPPGEAKNDQLKEIVDISSQTIREVREISYNLRPYQLGKLGLTKAIEAVIKSASSASNINFKVNIENIDNILPEDNDIHFYRIIQECLNNTIKHSHATGALINITKEGHQLLCGYSDNGVGFSKEYLISHKEEGGMGLAGISERVSILGGNINLEPEPNNGVKISIEIPLKEI